MCKKIGIYKITNPKGRIYIGQSVDLENRFYHYKIMNCKKQPRLYNSFLKYGVENHDFQILEECNLSYLSEKERYYQEKYNVLSKQGLNCVLTSYENVRGRMSEESKQKISLKNKGVNNGMYGKVSLRKGIKVSEEICKKQSESQKRLYKNGYINPIAKKVINIENGIIYNSSVEAWLASGLTCQNRHFRSMLSGKSKNKTNFKYI
jgi:group I intron endonuclease